MRIEYDPRVDAAYIYLTDEPLTPGRDSVPVGPSDGIPAMVVMDHKDGRLVGLEIVGAKTYLPADLLGGAETIGE
jgi:uncharacterized protein YuzE